MQQSRIGYYEMPLQRLAAARSGIVGHSDNTNRTREAFAL